MKLGLRRLGRCLMWPLCLAAVLCTPTALFSQIPTYTTEVGLPTYTSAEQVEMGIINLANGDLHLEIPMDSVPQRGAFEGKVYLAYDSLIWQLAKGGGISYIWRDGHSLFLPSSQIAAGWHLVDTTIDGGGSGAFTTKQVSIPCPPPSISKGYAIQYSAYNYTDSSGGLHTFAISLTKPGPGPCTTGVVAVSAGDAYTFDGYHLHVENYGATVYDKSGVAFESKDTNGNFMNFVDTGNRQLETGTGQYPTYYIDVLTSQNILSRYTLNLTGIPVSTKFQYPGATEDTGTIYVVQSILLPDNTSYNLTYDCDSTSGNPACASPSGQTGYYGQLVNITLPTGGTVKYGYSLFQQSTPYPYSQPVKMSWVTSRTTAGGTWNYVPAVLATCPLAQPTSCSQQVTVNKPSGDAAVHVFTMSTTSPCETGSRYYTGSATSGTLLRSVATVFDLNAPCSLLPTQVTTTLNTVGSTSLVKKTVFAYDSETYGNVTKIQQWNFVKGSTAFAATPDREYDMGYQYQSNSAYIAPNILNRVASLTVKGPGSTTAAQTLTMYDETAYPLTSVTGVAAHDDTAFGVNYTLRGNATTVSRWVSGTTYLNSHYYYDTTGQVIKTVDPMGAVANLFYDDNYFTDGSQNLRSPLAYTPAQPTHAFLTKHTLPLVGSTSYGYYFGSGKLAFTTDPNSASTYQHYVDPFDRHTHELRPDLGWTLTQYTSPTERDVAIAISGTTPSLTCTTCKRSTQTFDVLGRPTRASSVDPFGTDYVDVAYDSTGRPLSTSNPYRSPSDTTYGVQYTYYDGADRTTRVQKTDGSSFNIYYGSLVTAAGGALSQLCSSASPAYPTLTVDEAGKKRQTWTDGFGRIVEADEPNASGALAVATCYGYDANDNLTSVAQNGSRNRNFLYDGASRMTSSSNAESGTTLFTYDANGNVLTKKDARSITTTYTYDALNRITSKTYSDGTPPAAYFYDANSWQGIALTNTIGRLAYEGTLSGSNYLTSKGFSYDPTGRVNSNPQCPRLSCANGIASVNYTYDLLGDITSYYNGAGITFTQAFDSAGRLTKITSSESGSQYPPILATIVKYNPADQIQQITYGNGLTGTMAYNNRLQRCRYNVNSSAVALNTCADGIPSGNVQDFKYTYNSATDNGIIATATGVGTQVLSKVYSYDQVNRLSTMTGTGGNCTGLAWAFDAWGNRQAQTATAGTCPQPQFTFNAANQIVSPTGYTYDLSGNMTHDASHSYAYDAENRTTQVDGGTTSYGYEADGQRVQKISGTVVESYIYDLGGRVMVQTNNVCAPVCPDAHYVYLNNTGLVAEYTNSTTYFVHSDLLGSSSILTDVTGHVADCNAFLPFGEQDSSVCSSTGYTSHKFTGQERDSESNLDHFQFRKYSSTIGRFMSPDPAGMMAVDIGSPQTLNRYTYVLNNPLSFIDPFGLDCAYLNSSGSGIEKGGIDQNSSSGECGKTGGYWVDGTITQVNVDSNQTTISLTGTTNGTNQTNAAFQQNATVSVGHYLDTFFNPAGHIAFGLGNGPRYGLNPQSDIQFMKYAVSRRLSGHVGGGPGVPGVVRRQAGGSLVGIAVLSVTGMQAQMIQNGINQGIQNPPNYDVGGGPLTCDCASWPQKVLGDAGINAGPPTQDPGTLINQLNNPQPQQ